MISNNTTNKNYTVSLIAAMDKNRLIGNDNQLPWSLPKDLQHFKSLTWGKPIIMGRKSFESIGRPLPGRLNIVLSRRLHAPLSQDSTHLEQKVLWCDSLENAIAKARAWCAKQNPTADSHDIMIIGGANIYQQSLAIADQLFITSIDQEFAGDAWFPEWNLAEWHCIHEELHLADERHCADFRFMHLERCHAK